MLFRHDLIGLLGDVCLPILHGWLLLADGDGNSSRHGSQEGVGRKFHFCYAPEASVAVGLQSPSGGLLEAPLAPLARAVVCTAAPYLLLCLGTTIPPANGRGVPGTGRRCELPFFAPPLEMVRGPVGPQFG